jgi:hypothetical protein
MASPSQNEIDFRARIKEIFLGLLALEKVRARQRSRLTNIKHKDTNTKLFYLRANGRKRKKHIQLLHTTQGLASHMRTRKKKFLGILKSSWAQNTRVKLPSIGTSLTTLISTLRD